MDKILILDFGGQTCQLIARRIRELGIYTDIVPGDIELEDHLTSDVKGVILSGSPYSVYEDRAPVPDKKIYNLDVPLLGICYGLQRITYDLGGKVAALATKEYGRSQISFKKKNDLFKDIPEGFVSWMSHGDSLDVLAENFNLTALSEHELPASVCCEDRNIYGLQFHPEVTHCEYGTKILENFVSGICKAEKSWSMEAYIEAEGQKLRDRVGDKKVLLLISGGVDSTVAGGLLLKTLNPENVHFMYIDTGMMRKGESEEVSENLKKLGAKHLHLIDARDRFLGPLAGESDPEKKRKIIGNMFIEVQEDEIRNTLKGDYFLAQGTLYTDLIESGKGVGKNAQVIKSHHNVGCKAIEEKREAGLIIEPLERLYKDEVRALGRILGISNKIVDRHPFPGPGLGIRILGEVTKEKCDILRDADFIYINELRKRGLYAEIWQAFSVLLPVRSVGVAGDARDYSFVLALRAVVSSDGMTADVYHFPMKDLLEISAMITNSVKDIGRVTYDISSKPPATIEWE